jgi:hypothetical protein
LLPCPTRRGRAPTVAAASTTVHHDAPGARAVDCRPHPTEPDAWTAHRHDRALLLLDVHDVGEYQIDGESRELEPGMVMTVEPGIYIPPNDTSVRKCFRGVGIRIEDDIAITRDKPLVLSGGLVKTVADIEALMAG